METRNVTITLEKAIELFHSEDESLEEIALQAFTEDELMYPFKSITTFKMACEALGLNYADMACLPKVIAKTSRASAAMFKLNIIRKALNLGQDLHLIENPENPEYSFIYYPLNPFITKSSHYYDEEICLDEIEVIGKFKSEGTEYVVLGNAFDNGSFSGLGRFDSCNGVGTACANLGFLGCASKEIASHLGKYFGMLITEAKYGDMVDFEIVEDKYHNCQD